MDPHARSRHPPPSRLTPSITTHPIHLHHDSCHPPPSRLMPSTSITTHAVHLHHDSCCPPPSRLMPSTSITTHAVAFNCTMPVTLVPLSDSVVSSPLTVSTGSCTRSSVVFATGSCRQSPGLDPGSHAHIWQYDTGACPFVRGLLPSESAFTCQGRH